MSVHDRVGISGRIAKAFLETEITPLLALVGVLLGLFAVMVTPREEEPQIDVTMADIFIAWPGASAKEVESLVTTGAERILSEIEGVEHVYSVSQPGMSLLTVQFEVGEQRNDAIVRLYNAVYSNQDWLPPGNLGVAQPLIKPMGIDDVPIVTLTLWTSDAQRGSYELGLVARSIQTQLKRVSGTRNIYAIGSPQNTVRVELDAQKLAGYDLTVSELTAALHAAVAAAQHPRAG